MEYANHAIVSDGVVKKAPFNHGRMFAGIENFHLLTDEEKKQHGVYPCVIIDETYNPLTQYRNPPIITFDGSVVTVAYQLIDLPVDVVAHKIKDSVNSKRTELETAGVPYTFPDGIAGTIQTRNERDTRNVLGLVVAAQAALSAAPSKTFTFTDAENVTHTMTPTEVIAMGSHVEEAISAIYANSWAVKTALDQATTVDAVLAVDLGVFGNTATDLVGE